MSEALEALSKAEMALSFALSSMSHAQCRDDVKKAQNAHKAIRAALEQPSTAEAQARALDNLAAKLKAEANEVDVGRGHILTTIEIVEHEAKRIREEG